MQSSPAIEALADAVEAGGLIGRRSAGVVLISGGPDSACAAAALVALCGPESISAVHLNYGLRDDSGNDERAARELCAKLRIDLHVDRPQLGRGNLQARAREARYAAAEALRAKLGYEWIATGHTRTDVAETFLYRLAVSPGTRPLLGLPARSGDVVRPLHSISREETRAVALEAALPFVDDPSNASPRYARNRIRNEILPRLAEIGPEAERNIAATHAELHEEAELLSAVVDEALAAAGIGAGTSTIGAAELERMGPGLRRLVLRELAERAAGRRVALNRGHASRILALASRPEGGEVELGGGLSAVCEAGSVGFGRAADPAPAPVRMTVPGVARFGDWEVRAELREGPVDPSGPGLATLDAGAIGGEVEIRAWRAGDRMRPLGLGGTKTLQDLFTDQGVPRSVRSRIPVVTVGDRVAWVAGVAVGDEFRLLEKSTEVAVITARAVGRQP
ncbi:MAG: tRNA lysidine(34) synthetase TilS [Solirubrobacterales bacterium]|nr:tRNA lysidine(34) synthetase TilS [Solirubrobacterales bacterium]